MRRTKDGSPYQLKRNLTVLALVVVFWALVMVLVAHSSSNSSNASPRTGSEGQAFSLPTGRS